VASYHEHLHRITDRLSPALLRLARDISLHDSLFVTVTVAEQRGEVEMQLRCGDNETGYYDLVVAYRGVRLLDPPAERLVALLQSQNPEILYDEIDVLRSGYEHRFLLYPYSELVLQFGGIELQQTRVESRSVGIKEAPTCLVI